MSAATKTETIIAHHATRSGTMAVRIESENGKYYVYAISRTLGQTYMCKHRLTAKPIATLEDARRIANAAWTQDGVVYMHQAIRDIEPALRRKYSHHR